MKRKIALLLAAMMVTSVAAISTSCGSGSSSKPTLLVFNWGEYISDGQDDTLDVIEMFEEEFGCNVQYDTFSTN